MATICKNCNTSFDGRFCPMCSQRADTHRFSLAHFGHEAFHAITHTDRGIIFLIKELFVRPGKTIREYLEGKRKKYFNPFSFLLIMLAVQVYAYHQTNLLGKMNEKMEQTLKVFGDKKYDDLMKTSKARSEKALEYTRALNFIFLPFLALLSRLFFRKSNLNYSEHLVFQIFLSGEVIVLFLILCVLPFLLFPDSILIIFYVYFFLMMIYFLYAYKKFFENGWGMTVLKTALIFIIYMTAIQQVADVAVKYL